MVTLAPGLRACRHDRLPPGGRSQEGRLMARKQRGSLVKRGPKNYGARYYDEHKDPRYQGGFVTETAAWEWLDDKVEEVGGAATWRRGRARSSRAGDREPGDRALPRPARRRPGHHREAAPAAAPRRAGVRGPTAAHLAAVRTRRLAPDAAPRLPPRLLPGAAPGAGAGGSLALDRRQPSARGQEPEAEAAADPALHRLGGTGGDRGRGRPALRRHPRLRGGERSAAAGVDRA